MASRRRSSGRRASIASQIRPGVSLPLNLSIATMPVGEVTLISVSQRAADHVDADEQQPAALELGAERGADFALGLGQLGRLRGSAEREVGADFARARAAVDRAGDLALDQHDPLVALGDLGDERLQNVGLAIGRVEQLDQRGEVGAVAADLEHRFAGIAVERLEDDVAVLLEELARARRASASGRSAA